MTLPIPCPVALPILALAAVMCGSCGPSSAQRQADDVPIPSRGEADLIRSTERTRLRALVEADIETARRLHADDFQLINPLGGSLTKEQYLGGLASGALDYLTWDPETIEVRVYGRVAAIRYRSQLEIVVQGQKISLRRYWHTDLYEKRDGQWQVVWSHATEAS
jgi:Domain of unknown function (DUF4440)